MNIKTDQSYIRRTLFPFQKAEGALFLFSNYAASTHTQTHTHMYHKISHKEVFIGTIWLVAAVLVWCQNIIKLVVNFVVITVIVIWVTLVSLRSVVLSAVIVIWVTLVSLQSVVLSAVKHIGNQTFLKGSGHSWWSRKSRCLASCHLIISRFK